MRLEEHDKLLLRMEHADTLNQIPGGFLLPFLRPRRNQADNRLALSLSQKLLPVQARPVFKRHPEARLSEQVTQRLFRWRKSAHPSAPPVRHPGSL